MGPGRLRLAAGLAAACAIAQGCTDGTTPDCSDAQCLVVSVVEAGGDGAADGSADDADDSAADGAQDGNAAVSEDGDAGPGSGSPDARSSSRDAAVE